MGRVGIVQETSSVGISYYKQMPHSGGRDMSATHPRQAHILSVSVLGIISAFLFAAPCFAQSTGKLMDESIRAQGGKKALQRLRTSEWQGTARQSGSAETGEFTLLTESPGQFYREITFVTERATEACNGKSCWGESGEKNIFTFVGDQETFAKARAQFLNLHLLDLKKNKIRVQSLPNETLAGNPVNVVELTTATGVTDRLYLDAKTHLVLKEILSAGKPEANPGAPAQSTAAPAGATPQATVAKVIEPEEISFSDYRSVQGVMEPFHWEMKQGDKVTDVDFSRVSLNGSVNESAFNFPSLSSRPLPGLAQLLKDVDANQKKIDKMKEDYTYLERELDQQVDGSGKIKKETANLYEVSYVAGDEIVRQIEKGGKPLTPAEQQKEDARVQKAVLRDERKAAEKEKKPEKKGDDDVTIEDFLRISKFTSPRWERFRGQDVVVFDFGPNPDYKPTKLVEKAVHDLSGVVWIDPNARDVVRLEARFDNALKVGGGFVASLQKGSAFIFEQTLIDNAIWLPSYDEAHVGAKLFMIKTFRDDVIHNYYDYKKFEVSTKQAIGAPKPH